MIYFSEIKNKKVFTEDGLFLGRLDDLLFRYTDIPRVSKVLIRPQKEISQEDLYIPFEFVKKMNGSIIIAKNYTTSPITENELYIHRNIIDKQIIDFSGSKVVRVNDVLIQNRDNNIYTIVGADIGVLGILRWFGIAPLAEHINFMLFSKPVKRSVLSWSNVQPLEIARGKIQLNVDKSKLENLHPEDLADYLEATNVRNVANIITMLDKEFASEVVAELNINYQIALLKKLPLDKTVKIISLMDTDEAVDVLLELSPKKRDSVLEELPADIRKKVERLLKFSDSSIGKYLNTDFIAVKSTFSASKVLALIRKEGDEASNTNYIYVMNEKNQLTGVFTLYTLILQKPETPVYRFMSQNIIVTHLKSSLAVVLRRCIKYKISAIPVVDRDKSMLGVIAAEDISEVFMNKIQ
jgi:sporulation protein YlmC with PRC-barrel domain/CBS domain-containing protein